MSYDNDAHIVGARRRIKEKEGLCGRIKPLWNTLYKLCRVSAAPNDMVFEPSWSEIGYRL